MDDRSAVRVLQVDDDASWRSFVAARLLESAVKIIGTAVDGLEAVQKARALRPDVILMDIWMPRLNGLAATREIGALTPAPRILIVSNERDADIVDAAFAAGARGYVLKSLAAIDLLHAVDVIVRGDLFIGRGLSRVCSDNPQRY